MIYFQLLICIRSTLSSLYFWEVGQKMWRWNTFKFTILSSPLLNNSVLILIYQILFRREVQINIGNTILSNT